MNLEKIKKIEINFKTYVLYGTVRGYAAEENDIDEILKNNNFDLIMLGFHQKILKV